MHMLREKSLCVRINLKTFHGFKSCMVLLAIIINYNLECIYYLRCSLGICQIDKFRCLGAIGWHITRLSRVVLMIFCHYGVKSPNFLAVLGCCAFSVIVTTIFV